jgi:hypothetical protein
MSHDRSDITAGLPDDERQVVLGDVERLQEWARQRPDLQAVVTVDRSRFDAGRRVALVVIAIHDAPSPYRRELKSLVAHSDRLRVKAYRPPDGELERVLRWIVEDHMRPIEADQTVVTTAGIDDQAQLVVVTLNRQDQSYANELSVASDGLVRVTPEPTIVDAIPPVKVNRYRPT